MLAKFSKIFVFVLLLALMTACAGAPAAPAPAEKPAEEPAKEAPAAEEPAKQEAPAAEEPAAEEAAETGKLKVAVVVKAVTSDYWKLVGSGVADAMAADPTIEASFLGPNEETDIEGQIRIVEAQISAKVDALAVAPSQADQLAPTLQRAVDAGIPVVLIDTNIDTFTSKAAFVGTDNKKGGEMAGEFIVGQLAEGDEVAIIRGAAGDPVHNLREEGAKEVMEAAGLKVVAIQPADSDRAKGQTVGENLLTSNPNLKAIYATNDEMALGALNAAKAAGKTLVIVGFDASPDAQTSIGDGDLSGSVAQLETMMGLMGVENGGQSGPARPWMPLSPTAWKSSRRIIWRIL